MEWRYFERKWSWPISCIVLLLLGTKGNNGTSVSMGFSVPVEIGTEYLLGTDLRHYLLRQLLCVDEGNGSQYTLCANGVWGWKDLGSEASLGRKVDSYCWTCTYCDSP
jgi:hypothetical protein